MVQRVESAGTLPTEQSPLLSETERPNVGALNPSLEQVLNSVKKVDQDEESVRSGDVETGTGISRAQVVRIISVLLIGKYCFFYAAA
jgi:hypothetical protein